MTFVSTSGAVGYLATLKDEDTFRRLKELQLSIAKVQHNIKISLNLFIFVLISQNFQQKVIDDKKAKLCTHDHYRAYQPSTQCIVYLFLQIFFFHGKITMYVPRKNSKISW